jgi:aminomethyltransferase
MEPEWRRGCESAVLFDTSYHAVFDLSGPDRARYLNAITSGDVRGLTAGRGVPGLLLNAQGHILAEIETFALEERFLLLSHAMVASRTFETLDKYIIMDDCTLTDESSRWASCAVEGPRAAEVLAAVCGAALEAMPLFGHQEAKIGGAACRILRRSHFGLPGAEILAPQGAITAVWESLAAAVRAIGGGYAGWEAINSLRLEAGMRWFGADFDDTVIPHEAGLEHTHISYTKGCYTGQEIVERVRSRGKLNRWMVLLEFAGPVPPVHGAKLEAEGKAWGHVTSSAYSPVRKSKIGFGYLRREHNSAGEVLECGNGTARVMESPAEPPKNYFQPGACA